VPSRLLSASPLTRAVAQNYPFPVAECGLCGQRNPPGASFCVGCGRTLMACDECGAGLVPEGRFCPACGAAVGGEGAAPAEMIKLVTILFADVVGSTALEEQMRPDDARALLAGFFEAMSEEIRSEGGTIERLVGDAIMADFGVPVAREDDAERAVRAARRMFSRLARFNASNPAGQHLQMRIGINTGEVSTGGSLGQQLLVMGDAVNVAARLEQAADPGTILIGERTARAVRKEIPLRKIERFVARGRSETVNAYLVLDDDTVRADEPPPMVATMIGRGSERAVLCDLFERVRRHRTPLLATIVGDAGIGKSRLVEEFTSSLGDAATVLKGRCVEHGHRMTLWPFRDVFRRLVDVSPEDPSAEVLRKTLKLVKEVVPRDFGLSPPETAAALASTMSLEAARDRFRGIDPRQVQRELISSWAALLRGLALERPLVVVIEDLYRADDTTLDVLAEIEHEPLGPVMFVCTARPEFITTHPGWSARVRDYSAVSLAPLASDEVARLASDLLEVEGLPQNVRSVIVERAEGNPFFVEELVHRLTEEGQLRRAPDGWELDEAFAATEVPDTVQAVILARLDVLPVEARELLQRASVVGRSFPAEILSQFAPPDRLEAALDEVRSRRLIEEGIGYGGLEYSFKHVLIRDVAYDSLPRRLRGETHLAVARWLEEERSNSAADVAELLADHYRRAYLDLGGEGLRGLARDHLLDAARNAVRRFAVSQAEHFGARAIELSEGPKERIQALEELADLYVLSNRGDEAWRTFLAALEEARKSEDVDGALPRIAAKAATLATRFQAMIDNPVDSAEVSAVIDAGFGSLHEPISREAALLHTSRSFFRTAGYASDDGDPTDVEAERALRIAQELDDPDLLSAALDAICSRAMMNTDFTGAYESTMERLRLSERLTDLTEILDVHGVAAYICTYVGRYQDAVRHATMAAEAARGVDPASYWHALMWKAQAHLMLGQWDEALRDQAEIEEYTRVDGAMPHSASIRGFGVAFLIYELRTDPRADEYEEILVQYQKKAARAGLTFAGPLAVPARAMARRGRFEEARSWLSMERTIYLGGHLEALCDVVGEQADWQSAKEITHLAREEAARGGLLALPAFVDRLEGRCASALEDWRTADDLLRSSIASFEGVGALWEAAYSHLLLAEARAEGRFGDARPSAQRALELFDRLGSKREAERCRTLLRGGSSGTSP
jgi:class 3 adenylate cyclase